MAAEGSRWTRFACRFFSGATVLCFFLPLVGVSCGPLDGLELTGRQLMSGGEATVIVEGGPVMTGRGADRVPHRPDEEIVIKHDADSSARVVFCCAVFAFALTWVPGRKALIAVAVTELIGLVALGVLLGGVGRSLEALIASSSTDQLGENGVGFVRMLTQVVPDAHLDVLFGGWLMVLGFLVSAALSVVSALEFKSDLKPTPPRLDP